MGAKKEIRELRTDVDQLKGIMHLVLKELNLKVVLVSESIKLEPTYKYKGS